MKYRELDKKIEEIGTHVIFTSLRNQYEKYNEKEGIIITYDMTNGRYHIKAL